VLTVALAAVAALAGLTGTWSPCGFSMIETIGGPGRRVGTSCAAFAAGAVAGGVATFGLLAAAGQAVRSAGAGGPLVGATATVQSLRSAGAGGLLVAAAAIAVAGALGELRGAAISPQIRRQVPEHWRRSLPLPVAAGLYGVMLGLGFTTFVLTFAVWALGAVTFAVGRPEVGVVVGIAFGAARALPVVAIAPLVHRPAGARMCAALAERPRILRTMRLADAVALLLAAAALFAAQASGARLAVGSDPSAAGGAVAWTTAAGGFLQHEGEPGTTAIPAHAVLGGSLIAWRDGDTVHVANAADLTPVLDVTVPGVDAVAVSDEWLVTREPGAAGDELTARLLSTPDDVRPVATAARPAQLGRPGIDGSTIVYHVATPTGSRIVAYDLDAGTSRVLRRSRSALLANPSLLAGRLLYVRQTSLAQLLELGPATPGARNRVLYRIAAPAPHDAGYEKGHSSETRTPHPRTAAWTLWTSALSATRAYVTLLPRTRGKLPVIVTVAR
jgi:hypothetical protein